MSTTATPATLTAALATLDIEEATFLATCTADMVRAMGERLKDGQDAPLAATAVVNSALRSLGRSDDFTRSLLQDMLLHGCRVARESALAAAIH